MTFVIGLTIIIDSHFYICFDQWSLSQALNVLNMLNGYGLSKIDLVQLCRQCLKTTEIIVVRSI